MLEEKTKRIDQSGDSSEGNIIIDSGTTLTILPSNLYPDFESAVKVEIDLAPTEDPSGVLSLATSRHRMILVVQVSHLISPVQM